MVTCRVAVADWPKVPSGSMEPTLRVGDYLLVNHLAYGPRLPFTNTAIETGKPQRGDVVVFRFPPNVSEFYVKRLIGMPGDMWEERSGVVYINGKRLSEPYIQATRRDSQTLTLRDIPPRNTYTRIPKGYYLMMGDNRSSSCDSRRWGLVPRKNLIGKVFATYWPPKRISFH